MEETFQRNVSTRVVYAVSRARGGRGGWLAAAQVYSVALANPWPATRRALKRTGARLVGLHQENPKKATDRPTTERLLQAFANITLTVVEFRGRVVRHVTPLTPLQVRILELLDFSPDLYRSLASNSP